MSESTLTTVAPLVEMAASNDRFMQHLGIELVDGGLGWAAVRMKVGAEHLNFNGTCHGGALFSLADCAFGLASNSYGVIAAGIDVHMTFQVAVRAGETLSAVATEQSRSRKLAIYEIDICREDGLRVGSFTGTVYVTSRPHAFQALVD